jgi:hypothetical protein
MPTMTKLTRSDLRSLARVVVLANTAPSLYVGLMGTQLIGGLKRGSSVAELRSLYDRVTSRGRRTEVGLGIAYAALIALMTHDAEASRPDGSRLRWGSAIADLIRQTTPATQQIVMTAANVAAQSRVTEEQSASSANTVPSQPSGIVLTD